MNKRVLLTILRLLVVASIPFGLAHAEKGEKQEEAMEFFRGDPDIEYATPAPLLTNVYGRNVTSLNGKWEIIVDEPGMGWTYITEKHYWTDKVLPKTGMELVESSFDKRRQLDVPGDWNSQEPTLDRYRGKVLYHKSVSIKKRKGNRYFLHFGGANYVTDLFVNGKHVGRHEGGYTAFNFDITDYVSSGDNTFIVRVDAFLDDSTIPTMRTSDFWKYGGITRDVNLVTLPESYISQYHVYLANREQGEVRAWVQLGGEYAHKKVTLGIPDAGIKESAKTDANGRVEFTAKADLELWSPSSPKLYDVEVAVGKNRIDDRIGFRTIETNGKRIVLNGSPVKLHGISMHEETVLRPGAANTRADAEAQFALIKALGANFVRLAHYPHNEHTVKLADELGLMVWSEIPIVSLIDWDNEHTLEVAKTQIADNVSRDLNRAAVIMWSVANETFPKTKKRLNFLKALSETAKALDESDRLITAALIGNPDEEFQEVGKRLIQALLTDTRVDKKTKDRLATLLKGAANTDKSDTKISVMIDDPLGEVVDVVGYNEYFGWYYSMFFAKDLKVDESIIRDAMFAIMPDIRFENVFGKPMIISEFGAGAKKGVYSDRETIWSEEYQAKVYRHQLDMLEKSEFVQGMSPWILKDFRSHLRELNGIQETYNRKGLVSEKGEKKKAFFVLKDYYQQRGDVAAVNAN